MSLRERLFKIIGKKEVNSAEKTSGENLLWLWNSIYNGTPPWINVRRGGLNGGYRRLNCFNGARVVSHELANLCFSEQAEFKCREGNSKVFLDTVFNKNDFFVQFPDFLEKVFALGMGAIKVFADNDEVKLDFVDANSFIPLKLENGIVKCGAFISRFTISNKSYIFYEIHDFSANNCQIINRLFCENREVPLHNAEEVIGKVAERIEIKNLKKPLFTCFRPSIANYFGQNGLYGISVFAGAIDTLKSIDIVFDSLQREFVLGRKRIIVPTSAIRGEYDENGERKQYFDVNDEVFQAFSADDREELKIYDNSASLRIDEHVKALEQLLNILCAQVGLSSGSLSYVNQTAKTATEVISQNSKSHRTRSSHQKVIAQGLRTVCENILIMGKAIGALPINSSTMVEIEFDDSVITDTDSKLDNALKLFDAGIITKDEVLERI
ncbi:MAG: phage portal protein [Clostridiales bacterium]|nr:phage portal protein [Clostridiales bacterium]